MSVNKYQPHLFILSEDDAYRDMANGFVNHFAVADDRIHIAQPAGGGLKLLEMFAQDYAKDVRNYPCRHIVLLLDAEGNPESWRIRVLGHIPADIHPLFPKL